MSVINIHEPGYYRNRRRAETREYWLICCLVYPLSLAATIVLRIARLAGLQARSSQEPRRSVFAEAWAVVASSIPFAFK